MSRKGIARKRLIPAERRFPRWVRRGEKPKEFTFLGFTHYCGKTKEGHFKVKRPTSRKKLRQSLEKFTDWVKKVRPVLRKGEMLRQARIREVVLTIKGGMIRFRMGLDRLLD